MVKALVKFVSGAAIGVAVGWVAVRLLTPASGADLKERARAYRDEVVQAGKDAEEQRRAELQARFAQAKQFKAAPPPPPY